MNIKKWMITSFCVVLFYVLFLFVLIGFNYNNVVSDQVLASGEDISETELSYETSTYDCVTVVGDAVSTDINNVFQKETESVTEFETESEISIDFDSTGRQFYDCGVYAYDDEVYMLMYCVMAEAGTQSLIGKQLVADVILNRCLSEEFPDTIYDVITQPGQFEVYSNGSLYLVEPDYDCYYAVHSELADIDYPGVLYFRTGRYSDYGVPWRIVGDHYFSIEVEDE